MFCRNHWCDLLFWPWIVDLVFWSVAADSVCQDVRELFWNVSFDLLWLSSSLRKWAFYSQNYSLNRWPRHGWFGLSACVWIFPKTTHSTTDHDMVDLVSQDVRNFAWDKFPQLLIPKWSLWTLRLCVVCFQIYSLNCCWYGPTGCA